MPQKPSNPKLSQLRQQEYDLRLEVDHLRRAVYGQVDPTVSTDQLAELVEKEKELEAIEEQIVAALADVPGSGLVLDSGQSATGRRKAETTGIEAKIFLRMAQVPTSYYHLLDRSMDPLISCEVYAADTAKGPRRVRVTSYIEGYSAKAVNTFEVPATHTYRFDQLPTLFQDSIRNLTEVTRASLNILVEDLDGAVELQESYPIWLLARTAAPLAVRDPKTGGWRNMTHYLGAFVTPNAPSLMTFERIAARHHPDGRLIGYQINKDHIEPQVKAIFEALKEEGNITYVNSTIDFSPEQGFNGQRIRLPRESLADHEANCVDGTVLFASLLEAISLSPAIVLVPGHAFLAWETWRDRNGDSDEWRFLETTMIGSHTFEEACASAEKTAAQYKQQNKLIQWPLRRLRTEFGILPME